MQREEAYEDELIDAFDVDSDAPTESAGARDTHAVPARAVPPSEHASVVVGSLESSGRRPEKHGTSSSDQHHLPAPGALYPSFDDEPEVASVAIAPAKQPVARDESQTLQQLIHQRNERTQPSPQPEAPTRLLTSDELHRRRQLVEREMRGYQERFEHIAQALAGETPHQLEERQRRELGRLQREEKRRMAIEARMEQQVERLHEREARRAKISSKAHRASRSASPCSNDEENEPIDSESAVGGKLDAGGHQTEVPASCRRERDLTMP